LEEITMAVKTTKVANRRQVRYGSLQDVLRDAERLATGQVHTLGNKTYGQILRHLAIAMNMTIDGSPLQVPWFMRMLARLFKKKMLSGPMDAGFNLSAQGESLLWPPGDPSVAEGLEELRRAIRRLETESKREPSPFLGKLTHEEWNQLHRHHAELHMSFVVPD
jgi:hypothetical protein